MGEERDEAASRRRGAGLVLSIVGPALLSAVPVGAGDLASPGCLDGGAPAVVAQVEPPFDLRLDDGRLVRPAGLDAGAPEPASAADADARTRLGRWLDGRPVRVLPLDAAPDRWGRTRALVFAADSAGDADRPVSVGEALLDAGLARARPAEGLEACWPAYLRLEAEAREARRGGWSDPGRAVLDAADGAALRAHLGSFVVVEGVVTSLHEARGRTYLRFAGSSPDGFAASLDRVTTARLVRSGISPAAWLDHRVRVRGVVDDRWGLLIEVATPEQVEVVGR